MKRYLITGNNFKPFYSDYFNTETHFNYEINMIVYDLVLNRFTENGKTWECIEIDYL